MNADTSENNYIQLGNIHSFTTSDGLLKLEVSKISAEGDKTAIEIKAYSYMVSDIYNPPFISYCSIFSARGRKELINHLNSRFKNTDWTDLVEFVANTIHDVLYKPPEAVCLTTPTKPDPLKFLIYPIVVENYPNILYGKGSSAKSLLALFWGGLVAGGTKWWKGYGEIAHYPTLYCDWEMEEEEQRRRIYQLYGVSSLDNFYYLRCEYPIKNLVNHIHRIIVEKNIKFLIIDSLGGALGGDLLEAESAINFFTRDLRPLKVTTLAIAHPAKSGGETPFGSVFFHNYSRNTWELMRSPQITKDKLYLALVHQKSNLMPLHKPIGFEVTFSKDMITIERKDKITLASFEDLLPLEDLILSTLNNEPTSIESLIEQTGKSRATIFRIISKLKSNGKITKLENGEYASIDYINSNDIMV